MAFDNFTDGTVTNTSTNSLSVAPTKCPQSHKGSIREPDGTLYTSPVIGSVGTLYKSTDNGWSWEAIKAFSVWQPTGQSPGSVSMMNNPVLGTMVLYADHYGVTTTGLFAIYRVDKKDTTTYTNSGYYSDWFACDERCQDGIFSVNGNDTTAKYVIFVDDRPAGVGLIRILELDMTLTYSFSPYLRLVGSIDDNRTWKTKFDTARIAQFTLFAGVTNATTEELRFILIIPSEPASDWSVLIDTASSGGSIDNVAIAADGFRTICVTYTKRASDGTPTLMYSLSTTGGASWAGDSIPYPTYAAHFADSFSLNKLVGFEDTGFMLGGIFQESGEPKGAYVKKIPTIGGVASYYKYAPWERVNSEYNHNVTSMSFFLEAIDGAIQMPTLADFRVIYSVGEQTDNTGSEFLPQIIWTEKITNNAYPNSVPTTGHFDSMIDYYDAGYIGTQTTKYMNAFNNVSTELSLLTYVPVSNTLSLGKSGYLAPTVRYIDAILDPISLDNVPTKEGTESLYNSAVERDMRTIYIKPDTFLEREIALTDAGYVRRTIFVIRFASREYDLRQIVPHIIEGQICYWRANIYVMGVDNDPFTKLTIASET